MNTRFLWCLSTLDAASCCHQCLTPPGSVSSGSWEGGRSPSASASHDGVSNPSTPLNWCAARSSSAQRTDNPLSHDRVSCFDHGETVCPTGPKRGVTSPRRASEAQAAQREWDAGDHLPLGSVGVHVEEPAQTCPRIMAFCEGSNQLRSDNTK